MEIDDPTMIMSPGELTSLIESYRILVGVMLDHTTLHEGTDAAVADFLISDDPAADTLRRISEAQMRERQDAAS